MMEKLKYTKFKTLLISSFICISIIPVVLLGLFIFHLSKQELIRQSEKQMWQNAENVSDILDEKLDYIEEFSLKINDNQAFLIPNKFVLEKNRTFSLAK